MKTSHLTGLIAAVILSVAGFAAGPAAAQATRTWVSGVGDDANPCSRTAPCKTFQGTISKTAAGGEINCIDSAGFGAVTITKAIAIVCDNVESGIAASGTNGIIINAGATDAIQISGLDIEGHTSGTIGVRFLAGGSLIIQNSIIRGFNGGSALGVQFAPSGDATLHIANTLITENGASGVGGGVLIQPTGTGTAKVSVTDSRLIGNTNTGFWMLSTGNTGAGNIADVTDSVVANNAGSGIVINAQTGVAPARLMVNRTMVSNNNLGMVASGAGATARLGSSTVSGNATGVLSNLSAVLSSYGNNQFHHNTTANGSFTSVIATQ